MKKLYWHRHNLPRYIIISFCLFTLLSLFFVETNKQEKFQPYYKIKVQAAQLALKGFLAIKRSRPKKFYIKKSIDPQRSGLIGKRLTPLTTDSSQLFLKQSTINPNISALFIEWLKSLNVKPGDTVAVTMTGSFPALNISMLSAIKTLQLKPLLIFSAGASQYGANMPGFTWIDMYHTLQKKRIFDYPVQGISLGGSRDKGYGLNPEAKQVLITTIKKYHYPYLNSVNTIDGINKRMDIFLNSVEGQKIKVFINVGGSIAAIGLKRKKTNPNKVFTQSKRRSFATGVITKVPIALLNTDSVAIRFLMQGIPIINVHNINRTLLNKYQFPERPNYQKDLAKGPLFYHLEYNKLLTLFTLLLDTLVFVIIAILSRKLLIRYNTYINKKYRH